MTTEGARLLTEAEDDDRTIEETLNDLRERNRRLDWNVPVLLPEVVDEEQNQGRQGVQADD